MADVQEISLYERDFYEWALDQAAAVRALRDAAAEKGNVAAALRALDWENLIEELEGLARRDRSELRNRIATIVEHLLKLELSPADDPRKGWIETVRRSRRDVAFLIDDSPSLRQHVAGVLDSPILRKAAIETASALTESNGMKITRAVTLRLDGEIYSEAQVLEDWWPDRTEPNQ